MELRHLRYFLAVAETGNFRRAAEASFVAQSALSAQIARLEEELGVALFVRTTRSVRLTPEGETLRPLAARLVADAEHAQAEMAALRGLEKGRLRVGSIQAGPGQADLVTLLAGFHDRHPGIELSARTGASRDLAASVVAGDLDVAIVALPPEALPDGLAYRALATDPLVAVLGLTVGRALGDEVRLADLAERAPFIHYLPGSGLRHAVEAGFERAGVQPSVAFELGQIDEMVRLAATGVGVTVVPSRAVERRPDAAVVVQLADRELVHPVGVVHAEHRLGRAVAAFLEVIEETTTES